MTEAFYLVQIDRLRARFGAKAFDPEITKVLAKEVATLSEDFFRNTVSIWIGSRKNSNPPLAAEFRECKAAYDRGKLRKEVDQATRGWGTSLREVLRVKYNVDSLQEAFELEKLKIRLGGDNDQGEAK